MKVAYTHRLLALSHQLHDKYIHLIRATPTAFTRKRKLSLSEVFIQMIANKGHSQKNELYSFYSEVNREMEVSATAFFNARMKFNPETLLTIMQDMAKEDYEQPEELHTYKGYYVFAIDGTKMSLPTTPETLSFYGGSLNQHNKNKVGALAMVSMLYDCLNELFLDVKIDPYKHSEHQSARDHLACLETLLPNTSKRLIIFDRNYASIRLIDQLLSQGEFFIFRLQNRHFIKEQELLTPESPDQWIDVRYNQARANYYRKDFAFSEKLKNTIYRLRFVNLTIEDANGNEKQYAFVTNLPSNTFSTKEIGILYRHRWNIETAYRSLKSQNNVENFSGIRDVLIRQDIYAAAMVHNAISMTILENKKHQELTTKRKLKHRQKVNRNYALGVLKNDLLKMFILYENPEQSYAAGIQFQKNIVKYACPIRMERSSPRKKKGNGKNKHSYRKSF